MKNLLLLLTAALVAPMTTSLVVAQEKPMRVPQLSEVPNKKALARWNTPVRKLDVTSPAGMLRQMSASPFSKLQKAPAAAEVKAQEFKCALLYSDSWDDEELYGFYSFSSADLTDFKRLYLNEAYPVNAGGFYADGKFYYTSMVYTDDYGFEYDVNTYILNASTWKVEKTIEQGTLYAMAYDLTFDAIDQVAYGAFYDGSDDGSTWGYMDLEGNITKIKSLDGVLVAVAANEQGQVYAISDAGVLAKMDKKTGSFETIGYTGIEPTSTYKQSAAFADDGTLYWAIAQDDDDTYASGLLAVDITTGKASLIGAFDNYEDVVALYAEPSAAAVGAPLEPTDLTLNFVDDALTGIVSFGVPAQDNQGATLTGDVTYTINVDGEEAAKGTTPVGQKANVSVTVAKAGTHTFSVRLSNDKGGSQQMAETKWIGIDKPEAISNLQMEKTGTLQATVTWEAPTKGVKDGYFSADRISYDVIRMPEGKVVAEKIKETKVVDNIDTDGKLYVTYQVIPFADEVEGAATTSNGAVFGYALNTPVLFDFATVADYNVFTIIDSNANLNQDDGLWQYTTSGECAGYVCGTLDGDDWLITPEINLKADRQYVFSYDVLNYADTWPDLYEVYMGNAATVEAMTTQLVKQTTIYWSEYRTTTVVVTVPEDGTYNFGFHALSEAGGAFFLVDNISVVESYMLKAPVAVSDLKVVAGAKGAPTATVSFTAPTKAVDGSALTALTSIKVYRDSKVVKEFQTPTPGAALSFEESKLETLEYAKYTVVPATEAGEGVAASDSAWIGEDAPSEPTVHISVVNDHPVLTWEAPQGVGQNGGYFDPSTVTYIIYDAMKGKILAQGVTATTYTDATRTLTEKGDQALYQYGVFAQNETGTGYPGTAFVIDGKKYDLPYKESFANGAASHLALVSATITGTSGYDKWGLDADYNVESQDGDGGSMLIMPATAGAQSTIQMGKIDMTEAKNATLSFHVARLPYDNDFPETDPEDDHLDVYVGGADYETTLVKSVRPYDHKNTGYVKYTVPLTQYEGTDFIFAQFQMNADAAYYAVVLDNIQVRNNYEVNLQASALTLPASVDVTKDFDAVIEVTNDGVKEAKNFAVTIKRGAEVLAAKTYAQTLASFETLTDTFRLNASSKWADTETLIAEVTIAGDEYTADDTVESELAISRPQIDAVSDLNVTVADGNAIFSWTAPVVSASEKVVEGFEDYAHGARSGFGEWSTIDVDGSFGYGLDEIDLPSFFGTRAFTVIDPAEGYVDWATHSGSKMIGAVVNWEGENDDWLVSPELTGKAQTVTFWARSIKTGVDNIYFYYSTGGKTVADFKATKKLADNDILLTTEWTQYTFELPEGAKYFAIRYYTDNGQVALIDDVEFEKVATYNVTPEVEGYNLYCDDKLVNDEVIVATTYTLTNAADGSYTVRVVYNVGESAASNAVTLSATGIENITADAVAEQQTYDVFGRRVETLRDRQLYIRKGQKFMNSNR